MISEITEIPRIFSTSVSLGHCTEHNWPWWLTPWMRRDSPRALLPDLGSVDDICLPSTSLYNLVPNLDTPH